MHRTTLPLAFLTVAFLFTAGCREDAGEPPADDDGGRATTGNGGSGGSGVTTTGVGGSPAAGGGAPAPAFSLRFDVDGVPQQFATNANIVRMSQLELWRGWAGATTSDDENFLNFHVPETIGTHTCANARITYKSATAQYRASDQDGSCEISVDSVGDLGEAVTGTFSGTLVRFGSDEVTVRIDNGRFELQRGSDQ